MAGTVIGGIKAAQTNKAKHGEDFYREIGAKGGKSGKAQGTIKGFAADPNRARWAGALGGKKSRRPKKQPEPLIVTEKSHPFLSKILKRSLNG